MAFTSPMADDQLDVCCSPSHLVALCGLSNGINDQIKFACQARLWSGPCSPTITIVMYRQQSFRRLFKHLEQSLRIPRFRFRFLIDGERISQDDTPDTLNMEDGDLTDICFEVPFVLCSDCTGSWRSALQTSEKNFKKTTKSIFIMMIVLRGLQHISIPRVADLILDFCFGTRDFRQACLDQFAHWPREEWPVCQSCHSWSCTVGRIIQGDESLCSYCDAPGLVDGPRGEFFGDGTCELCQSCYACSNPQEVWHNVYRNRV